MKVLILFFYLILGVFSILPQSAIGTGTIKGKVVDKGTGEPLIGANVILLGTEYAAATNVDGNYIIYNVSPGSYFVKVAYIGYNSIEIENTKIIADKCELIFEMTTSDSGGIIIHQRFIPKNKTACTFRITHEPPILPIKGFYLENFKDKLKTHPFQMDSIKIHKQ